MDILMFSLRVFYLAAFLVLATFLTSCQYQETVVTEEFFLPASCINSAENYLNESYVYLQDAEISYKLKPLSSVPLHLSGAQIIEVSWLKSHDIQESVVANFNSIFRECDVNDGVISFDLKQSDLTTILSYLEEKGPHEKLIIYIQGDSADAFYTDRRPRSYNIDHLQNP